MGMAPPDVYALTRELVVGATGAVVLLNERSLAMGIELGMMAQNAIPILVIQPSNEALSRLVAASPVTQIIMFDREGTELTSGVDVVQGVRRWIEQLPRRSAINADAISADELHALERFLAAFNRAMHDSTTGLNEPDLLTVHIHTQTLQLQLRAPEPNRSIIKSTLKAIGTVLLGVGGGAAGNYLYSLLPHLH